MPSTRQTDDDFADLRAAAIADGEADPWSPELTKQVLAAVKLVRKQCASTRAQAV